MAEAEKLGVILHNGPLPPPADRDTANPEGAVTASFDSAFEVDKDVAHAIKEVLRQLADQSRDHDREHDYEQDRTVISDLLQSHITSTSEIAQGSIRMRKTNVRSSRQRDMVVALRSRVIQQWRGRRKEKRRDHRSEPLLQ